MHSLGGFRWIDELGNERECLENWKEMQNVHQKKKLCALWKMYWSASTGDVNTFFTTKRFGFLLDVKTLLFDTDEKAIRRDLTDFANFYDTDINGHELFTAIGDCRMLLVTELKVNQKLLCLFGFIVSFGDDVFPNLHIPLQILFTTSFNCKLWTVFQQIETYFVVLACINGTGSSQWSCTSKCWKKNKKKDYDDVIDQFTKVKCRKINWW